MATAQSTAVSGRIVEGGSAQPVPFASVVAYQSGSEQFIGGTTTDMEGNFELVISETVDLSITLIGFDTLLVEGIENDLEWIDLGDLALVENTRTLNEVEIVADKSIMEFQLDKRVFNERIGIAEQRTQCECEHRRADQPAGKYGSTNTHQRQTLCAFG